VRCANDTHPAKGSWTIENNHPKEEITSTPKIVVFNEPVVATSKDKRWLARCLSDEFLLIAQIGVPRQNVCPPFIGQFNDPPPIVSP
jgi:hypothetical protein